MAGKILASTQDHLDIAEIKSNCVILKNGSACYVLQTTAINFDLLSMIEQDAAISSYSALLNALTFPIQITIRSKRLDISEYIEKIKEREIKEQSEKIRGQLAAYRKFIQVDLVAKEQVLDKKFYVTIPFGSFNLSLAKANPVGFLGGFFGPSKPTINIDKVLKDAVADLEPKKNFLIKEFARVGIKAKHLNTNELIKLFYDFYNSDVGASQQIRGNVAEYSSALVEPKLI